MHNCMIVRRLAKARITLTTLRLYQLNWYLSMHKREIYSKTQKHTVLILQFPRLFKTELLLLLAFLYYEKNQSITEKIYQTNYS